MVWRARADQEARRSGLEERVAEALQAWTAGDDARRDLLMLDVEDGRKRSLVTDVPEVVRAAWAEDLSWHPSMMILAQLVDGKLVVDLHGSGIASTDLRDYALKTSANRPAYLDIITHSLVDGAIQGRHAVIVCRGTADWVRRRYPGCPSVELNEEQPFDEVHYPAILLAAIALHPELVNTLTDLSTLRVLAVPFSLDDGSQFVAFFV